MRSFVVVACISTLSLGCSSGILAPPSQSAGLSIQGDVHGGLQPIVGAHIYLMAANTAGYGAASVSLLDVGSTHLSDSVGAYVLTNSGGGFSISGDYSCAPGQQVYLLALGGDTGSGVNPASALMAVLGECPAGSTSFLATHPFISVTEVTTVAGAYALAGYMTDALHVSSSGTALANTGIANAFQTAAELADVSHGTANSTTPAGNGAVPQSKINMLANILSACVDSQGSIASSPVQTPCYTLFSNATSDGTSSGTQPTDTVTAAVNIAHNPGMNVANLLALQPAVVPFQAAATTATDLTLAINVTGGGALNPLSVAIDSYGNIWVANGERYPQSDGNVSKFAAGTGTALSPEGTGFNGGGIYSLRSVAVDTSNNVWTGSAFGSGTMPNAHLNKLAQDGSYLSSTGYDLGPNWFNGLVYSISFDPSGNPTVVSGRVLSKVNGTTGQVTDLVTNGYFDAFPSVLATEPNGNIWVGSIDTPYIFAFDPSGTQINLSTASSGPSSGLYQPWGMAIDHDGNVWVANGGSVGSSGAGVAEFSSNGTLLSPPEHYPFAGDDEVDGAANGIAIDGDGRVIVLHSKSVSRLNSDGTLVKNSVAFKDSSINRPTSIAIDGSGNVWLTNPAGSSLTEFIGLASPVVTPIAAGVAHSTLGTRP